MTVSQLLALSWAHRTALIVCLVIMLGESAATLALPWLVGQVASGLWSQEALAIGPIATGIIGLLALQTALRIASGFTLAATSQRIIATLRGDLYDHLQSLPINFFHARRPGDILALLTGEIEELANFMTGTLLGLVPKALTFLGALVLIVHVDPLLAIPVVIGIPVFFVVLKLLGRRVRPLSRAWRDAYADMFSIAEQNLAILPAIKSFTREALETTRYRSSANRLRDLSLQLARLQTALGPILYFVTATAIVALVWMANARISSGSLAPGELVAFLLYAALLTRPISDLAHTWGQLQRARGALTHLDAVLQSQPEPYGSGCRPTCIRGAIAFERVRFTHPDRPPVLGDISLEVPAGEIVALTGPNGAGKSTLVALLQRLYVPDSGRITLDGRDIQELDLHSLRQSIGLVPQEPMLFDGTLQDNLLFGNPVASRDDIETALRRAQAAQFIDDLPLGLQTLIGAQGLRLSGGQRQRIALARALLKDPAVLILDEPTAMFDPDGEAGFVADIRQALCGRTVFLITHRPASLALAHRVVRLKAGQIVSQTRNREGRRYASPMEVI